MKRACCGRYAVAAVLLVALALRIGAAVWWQGRLETSQAFQFGDSHTYWVLAKQIQNGQPYQYGSYDRIFRTPGYPLLLAGLFQLAGSDHVLPARLMGALFGTISIGLLMLLAYELFDRETAILAGGLAAIYPGAIAMSVLVLSESPFCPWMIAHLWCWLRATRGASRASRFRWSLTGGAMAAVATLIRPSWLLFTPFAFGCALVFFRGRRRQLVVGLAMLAGLTIVMLPWWVRNYRVAGVWVPTTLQVGASLYDGIRPNATGASDMRFMDRFREQQRDADRKLELAASGFELRLSNRLKQAAIEHVQQEPLAVARLMARKFTRMWSPLPNAAELQNSAFRILVAASYIPLLLASIVGVFRFGHRDWGCFLCLLPTVYFTSLHMVFVSSIRYRLPAMLILTVLASAAIVSGWRQRHTPDLQRN